MTGYAVNTRECAAGTITIELKSVNSRFLGAAASGGRRRAHAVD